MIYVAIGIFIGHLIVAVITRNFKLTPLFIVVCALLAAADLLS